VIEAAGNLAGGALDTIAAVSPWLLGLAIALHLLKITADARAWHGIVAHAHGPARVPFRTSLAAFVGSVGANACVPARAGEAFRVGVVRRELPGSNVATLTGTLVLEATLELVFAAVVVGALVFGGGSIDVPGIGGALAHPVALVALVAALVGGAVLALVFRRRAVDLGRRLARGFSIVGASRAFVAVCGWKVAAWTLRISSVVVFLLAFHLPATLWTALAVIGAQKAAGTVPVVPGNAGAQQAAFAVVLTGTAGAATVLGFGVGMQATTLLVDVVAGTVAVAFVAGGTGLRGSLSVLRGRPSGATTV